MSFILNFLMEAVLGILAIFFNFFIDVTTSTFSLNGKNTLNLFYKTFPGSNTVMQWSQYCGLLIIVAIFFFQLIKIMSGPITKAERPLTLVCRTIIFAAAVGAAKPLCEFIFEVATGPFKAMKSAVSYDIVGNVVDALKNAGNTAGKDIAGGANGVSDFVVGMIAPLITFFLIIALFGAFFKLLLEVVERYLIIGVLTIFSPLAIATGCSSATNNIFGSWLRAMISQCLLMIFSVFFLSVLYNGMIQICVDAVAGAVSSVNLTTSITAAEPITSSSFLCIRVMMLVAWCRLGTTMDRHLQTLGLTTLQAGDGLAMDLRNAGSMAKGAARSGGRLAGAIAAGAGAFAGNKAANGAGSNNNSTINSASGKNSNAVGSGSGATKPGVGSSSMGGSSQGQGISLNSMCGPAGEALKNAADGGITAGNGVEEDGVTKFPLSGPNGEDMGDITLSKDAPEEGRFASITDDDGNTLYAQASNDDIQDLLDNEDAFIAANADDIGGVTNEGADSSELDDASTIDGTDASMVAGEGAYISDDDNVNQEVNIADEGAASFDGDELQEANAALDDVQTFDSAALDENGDIVEGSVPSSVSEDQVSFDENGNPYYDADGQKVPLDTNDDGSYSPANYGIVANSNGAGEFVMANDGSMYAAASVGAVASSSTNIPANQVKTDSNGNPYYSTGGQNIPVKKNSDGSYSLSGAIPASQIKTDSNGNTYCNVGNQNIPVAKNSNGSYSPATSISASQVKNDANGNPYYSVGGQNIPVAKNSDGSYSPTASATSISASQVKADNNGNTYCSVGEQNIPVAKNSDGSYSPTTTSIPSASSGLFKNSQGAQPGDSVVAKDSNGNLCSTTLSSSNFSSVSAKGFDGKMHDCKGQLSSNGTVNPSHLVATGFSNVSNMSLNKDGSATLSASDGKKYSVPAANVAVGSNGQVGIRTNGANSFSAKDSSGNSRTFNVSNSAMVSKDKAFCPVNNSSNGSGKTPTNIHYSGLSNKIVADAKNVKVVGSKDSYASKYNLRKDQRVPVSLVGAIKTSGDSNGKKNNMVGTIRGKDVTKLRKNNSKKK